MAKRQRFDRMGAALRFGLEARGEGGGAGLFLALLVNLLLDDSPTLAGSSLFFKRRRTLAMLVRGATRGALC